MVKFSSLWLFADAGIMAAEIIMIAQMPTVANRLILFMFDSSRFFRLHIKSQQEYCFIDSFGIVIKFRNEILFKL